jgi:hypothetical protein
MIVIQRHLERPNKGEIVGRARGGGVVGFPWIVRGRLAGMSLFFCEKFVRYSCINKIKWRKSYLETKPAKCTWQPKNAS